MSPASPTLVTTPSPTSDHAGHDAADPDRLGRRWRAATTRPARSPSRCYLGSTPGGHRDGHGQRQRHLHDADRLHAADHGHGDGHLPVGRQPTDGDGNNNTVSDNNATATSR